MRLRFYVIVIFFIIGYFLLDYFITAYYGSQSLKLHILELMKSRITYDDGFGEIIYDAEETDDDEEISDPSKQAYVTLCVGDNSVQGTMVLFHSLSKVKTKRKFVAMVRNVSESNLLRLKSFGVEIVKNEPLDIELLASVEDMEDRDQKLMSKLRVWELVQYQKIVQMDSDMIALQNVDELFEMPEISACPMSDDDEKILFYERAGIHPRDYIKLEAIPENPRLLPGWSGLNSGIVVLKPSLETFNDMMSQLSKYPRRLCCPSQEFLYNYFERKRSFFRLPTVYNTRRLGNLKDARQSQLFEQYAKVYHFVYHVKPWENAPGNRTFPLVNDWWKLSDEVDEIMKKKGLGIVEADPMAVRRH